MILLTKFVTQTGAAMVEFAIVLPLFVFLIFVPIEFGFALYDKGVITNAARNGARSAIIASNTKTLATAKQAGIDKVTSYCTQNLISLSNLPSSKACTTTFLNTNAITQDSPMTIQVSYTYTGLFIGKLSSLVRGTPLSNVLNMTAVVTMYNE